MSTRFTHTFREKWVNEMYLHGTFSAPIGERFEPGEPAAFLRDLGDGKFVEMLTLAGVAWVPKSVLASKEPTRDE